MKKINEYSMRVKGNDGLIKEDWDASCVQIQELGHLDTAFKHTEAD